MLNTDGGAIYGARGSDLTGTVVHHNWIYNNTVAGYIKSPAHHTIGRVVILLSITIKVPDQLLIIIMYFGTVQRQIRIINVFMGE